MCEDYGSGINPGDWTSDQVPPRQRYRCTECNDSIPPNAWFFQNGKQLVCGDCVTLVLNGLRDAINDLEMEVEAESRAYDRVCRELEELGQ